MYYWMNHQSEFIHSLIFDSGKCTHSSLRSTWSLLFEKKTYIAQQNILQFASLFKLLISVSLKIVRYPFHFEFLFV